MANTKLVDKITEAVLARLEDRGSRFWGGCRTVSVQHHKEEVRYILACGAARVGFTAGAGQASDLARYIDHTLLRANATRVEIEKICEEALKYKFAAVCINPVWVGLAADWLLNAETKVCTVVGFPLGANRTDVKVFEARSAIFDGAMEIDMVMNVGALKSGNEDQVREDMAKVVDACHEKGVVCKVILETAFLSQEEKETACRLAKKVSADFVKTSTGFGPAGATVEDVRLMRRIVGPDVGVKAAGGIHDRADTEEMLEAGANRIGASAGVKIIQGLRAEERGEY